MNNLSFIVYFGLSEWLVRGEEDADGSGCSLLADGVFADPIGLGKSGDDVGDVGRLVALATQGNGSHVRGVRLQDDAVKRYTGRKNFWQV